MDITMIRLKRILGIAAAAGVLLAGCESVTDSTTAVADRPNLENDKAKGASSAVACHPAGDTGLTAAYVNESVNNATIDMAELVCNIPIYFDENAPKNATVRNTTIIQESAGGGESTGVWNNGGDVTVTRSTFITDFAGQHLSIRYDDGATGTISDNELSGTHRVGILVRGNGTEVHLKGNTIAGSGAKTSGWAENGIQVDQEAVATIVNNEISGHWWDGESNFGSTGLLLWSNDSRVSNNTFRNNEFSIFIFGSTNRVTANETISDVVSVSSHDFKAYGALLAGSDNHLAGNSFSSADGTGAVGIYIYPGSSSNKVTGNRISGFDHPLVDGGESSMIRGTPAASPGK